MSIPVIDTLHALGNFPVVNSDEVQCGNIRLDAVLSASATELATKANKTYVDTELAKKANTEDVTTAVNAKADKTYVDTELAKKATPGDISTAISGKADKSYVDTSVSGLASTTYVDTALSSKLNVSVFNSYRSSNDNAVNAKADKSYVDSAVALKANTNDVTEALSGKANNSQVTDLDNRIDTVESEQAVLSSRMDGFASLTEGSTTGDAELEDIRVGFDGKTYSTAGNAVRGQVSNLNIRVNAANTYTSTNLYVQQNLTRDEGHYYSPSAGYTARDGYSCYLAEVEPFKTYYTFAESYVIYDSDMGKLASGSLSGSVPKGFSTVAGSKYVAINYSEAPTFIQQGTDGYWLSLTNGAQTISCQSNDVRFDEMGSLTNTNLVVEQKLTRDIGHYFSPSAGYTARTGSSCYLVEVEPNTVYYTTVSSYVVYDVNMNKLTNADLSLALVRPIATPSNAKYVALNYLSDVEYIQPGTDGYWISKTTEKQGWAFTSNDRRLENIDYLYSEITKNNRRIVDAGIVFDCSGMINDGHCKVVDSPVTKFSKVAKRVMCENTGDYQRVKIKLPQMVSRDEFKSITIVFYAPQGSLQTDESGSGRFSIGLGGTKNGADYTKMLSNTHNNARSVYGWNSIKFAVSDFTSDKTVLPEFINSVYVSFSPRSTVAQDAYYGGFVFDSVIFNQKSKPTVLLNFDQWWNESENNGGYAIAENRGIPYTVFTAAENLNATKVKKALYRENVYGVENAVYGGYINTATNVKYSDAKSKYETEQNYFTDAYLRTNVSYGCKHNWYHPAHIAALRDSGVQLIRTWSAGLPIGYVDKDIYYISTIAISSLSIEQIKNLIDRAIDEGSVLPLFTHGICADGNTYMTGDDGQLSASDGIQLAVYTQMCNYIKEKVDAGLIECMSFKDFYIDCIK